ncbi:hypothetical protein AB434_0513 [Heyndrickxia coagulans]|jgi:hypothetical protein|uniref:Uncharacterized protein n=1 Tax=Heyndrickxia coagulans TaxID=1398 RepID=A0AAN0T2E1_HEYCO|nr:hypothetical protein SB48_HM08orf01014 [Heyndrickxia coagulans]AKN52918.1 hypothetical protein AB434_0513 [Heyndrickxia coagulans]KYC82909.1 hypothetical protein B4096_1903 [Heyndrickxia coagulans]
MIPLWTLAVYAGASSLFFNCIAISNAKQKTYTQRIDRGDDRLAMTMAGFSLPVFLKAPERLII